MRSLRSLPAASALLLAITGAPAPAYAQQDEQLYECVTTTTTRTEKAYYKDGTIIITTVTVSSTICTPL